MGVAVSAARLNDSNFTQAAKEFNFITPENEMKWDTTEPSRGTFNYGPGDQVVNFASQNNMKVKGHTLVWHNQLPNWVNNVAAAEMQAVMVNHITQLMTHYKGKMYAWDVVNEAWETTVKKGDGTATLGKDAFSTKIGETFIDLAFQTARQVDPDALLFYNDYATEGINAKSDAVYNMVKSMLERKIPIDGVGIQTHIGTPNDTPTAAEVTENIQRLTDLGLKVMISEMDVNGCDGYTDAQTAAIYHDIIAACTSNPGCTAVTLWGISDKDSWLNSFGEANCNGKAPKPLLWDNNYQKKPAYSSTLDALLGK
jgi:endo-1,4-beta-xylanase